MKLRHIAGALFLGWWMKMFPRWYHVSLTALDSDGKRWFARMIVTMPGSIFPIQSVETKAAEMYGFDRCVILSWQRVNFMEAKYATDAFPMEIHGERKVVQ